MDPDIKVQAFKVQLAKDVNLSPDMAYTVLGKSDHIFKCIHEELRVAIQQMCRV